MTVETKTKRSWRKRFTPLLFLAALSFLYFWLTRFKAPKQIDVAALGLTAPSGTALPPDRYEGKAVILNFWAPWCGPCNLEAPWLQAIQDKHARDLLVIGVNDDPDANGQMAEFAVRNGVRYPLVTTNIRVHNAVGSLAGVPTTLYIDRAGNVVHTITGAIPQALMEKFAEDAMKH